MYGKTLADFPERQDLWADEFALANPDRLEEAFRCGLGIFTEFPAPADLRKIYDKIPVSPERMAAARERVLLRLAAQPEPKQLKSTLDESRPARREIRQLSESETAARLKVLLQQAQDMRE